MTSTRYGFYLLPPYPIVRDITQIHTLLEKQFGFKAAGQFQVHCTVKGFFKKIDGPLTPLINELGELLTYQNPFKVEINGILSSSSSLVLDLSRIYDSYNRPFFSFRTRVVDIIRPYIAHDCDFIKDDLGNPFMGHITLAFRDSPTEFHGQVISWLDKAPIPSGIFSADIFHFVEFFSENWDGPWWETLTWKLHKSWSL